MTKVSEAFGVERTLAQDTEQKLMEQENIFSKNYDNLKQSTRVIEKETQALREKYQQKTDEAKELIKSLQLAEKTVLSYLYRLSSSTRKLRNWSYKTSTCSKDMRRIWTKLQNKSTPSSFKPSHSRVKQQSRRGRLINCNRLRLLYPNKPKNSAP